MTMSCRKPLGGFGSAFHVFQGRVFSQTSCSDHHFRVCTIVRRRQQFDLWSIYLLMIRSLFAFTERPLVRVTALLAIASIAYTQVPKPAQTASRGSVGSQG